MPLLAGETLEARLRREGALPVVETVRIARETAEGLAAAHARGLIHRDVKPANLWLEAPAGRVEALDFGLARAEGGDGLTQQGAVLGTPGYMAPEQTDGQELDTARADLFSLGCVLYRMLTGRPAFEGRTISALLLAVTQQSPTPPAVVNPAVPAALSALVMQLLAKNREGRPADSLAVVDALTAIGTPPPSPLPEAERGREKFSCPVTPGSEDSTRGYIPKALSGNVAPGGVFGTRGGSPPPRNGEGAGGGVPRWMLGVAALVLLAGLAIWLLTRSGKAPLPEQTANPESSGGNPLPVPVSYRGSVDLLVHRLDADGSDIAVPLSDPRAMPLRPDDHFKIIAEIKPPAYLYLFWVDETGAGCRSTPGPLESGVRGRGRKSPCRAWRSRLPTATGSRCRERKPAWKPC